MAPRTLDYQLNIIYDSAKSNLKNLHALSYIPDGLYFLAKNIRDEEIKKFQTNEAFSFLTRESILVANIFSWFSISLVNYLRLVALVDLCNNKGWASSDIKENRQSTKDACGEYVKSVVPEILLWRNKIGAHFAITDPWYDDNIATLEFSVMNSIIFSKPYYKIGIVWGTQSTKSDIPQWSLTEIFEKLAPRFWPDKKLDVIL